MSGHHPSANGQVEQLNSTLEQFLWISCNYEQDNWSKLLPLAEFTYNNAPHASTGVSLFFVTCRYNPLIAVYPGAKVMDLCAKHIAINFDEVHKFLYGHMQDAQDSMAQYTNQDCMESPLFHVGDHTYICTDNIQTNRTA